MASPTDLGFRRALADCLAGFGVMFFAVALEIAGVVFVSTFGPGLAFIGLLLAVAGVAMVGFGVHEIGKSAIPPAP